MTQTPFSTEKMRSGALSAPKALITPTTLVSAMSFSSMRHAPAWSSPRWRWFGPRSDVLLVHHPFPARTVKELVDLIGVLGQHLASSLTSSVLQ
jgi:hypothetical protein